MQFKVLMGAFSAASLLTFPSVFSPEGETHLLALSAPRGSHPDSGGQKERVQPLAVSRTEEMGEGLPSEEGRGSEERRRSGAELVQV